MGRFEEKETLQSIFAGVLVPVGIGLRASNVNEGHTCPSILTTLSLICKFDELEQIETLVGVNTRVIDFNASSFSMKGAMRARSEFGVCFSARLFWTDN